ncbi:MAG: hypothetical protein ACRD28_07775 [Acidobacteriaceae bacterium]
MGQNQSMLPVWFFVGVLLTIYGIITLVTALTELSHPPATVLSQYHPGIWVGVVLILIGGFYTLRFRPGRDRNK